MAIVTPSSLPPLSFVHEELRPSVPPPTTLFSCNSTDMIPLFSTASGTPVCLCNRKLGESFPQDQLKRYTALHNLSRLRAELEETLALTRLHELDILEQARLKPTPDCGHKEHTAYRRAQEALPIARAVRDTILAKRRVAIQRSAEAKLRMEISRGVLDAVGDRITQQLDEDQISEEGSRSKSAKSSIHRRRRIRHRLDGSKRRASSSSFEGSSDDTENSGGSGSRSLCSGIDSSLSRL